MRVAMSVGLALSVALLAGCAADSEDSVDEGTGAVRTRQIDVAKFSMVNSVLAYGEKAEALESAMKEKGARMVGGRERFVGLSERELEGKEFDPNEDPDDVFGITCGLDGATEQMSCALRVVVRKADVEGRRIEGVVVPTKTVVSGKLAAAIAETLPEYRALNIACTGEGRETKCTVPSNGLGAAASFDEVPLPKEEAIEFIKYFFPEG